MFINNDQRRIGLHLRLEHGLLDVVQAVEKLKISVVQSFLLDEEGGYVSFSESIIQKFLKAKQQLGFTYFVHAAYWSNLTDVTSKQFTTLLKEAEIAAALQAAGIVIHIGAFRPVIDKTLQVKAIATSINQLLDQVKGITLYLENSPHAGRNFGGDINDFALLINHVEQKHRIKFCLDTAHAFVYGYDLTNPMILQHFFNNLQNSIGPDYIGLLHLNEADRRCGSYIDKHGIIGSGQLGNAVLQKFLIHPLFIHLPVIIELPGSCQQSEQQSIVDLVESWL